MALQVQRCGSGNVILGEEARGALVLLALVELS